MNVLRLSFSLVISLFAVHNLFSDNAFVNALNEKYCNNRRLVNAPPYILSNSGKPVFQFAVINQSKNSLVTDSLLQQIFSVIKTQVTQDFAPHYGLYANFTFFTNGSLPSDFSKYIPIFITDTLRTSIPDILAFHDKQDPIRNNGDPISTWIFSPSTLPNGLPYIVIPMGTETTGYGVFWAFKQQFNYWPSSFENLFSFVVSNEILETLADPVINMGASNASFNTNPQFIDYYFYEVCDPVEWTKGYIIDGFNVANFALPSYWNPNGVTFGPFDFLNTIPAPLTPFSGEQLFVHVNSNCVIKFLAKISLPENPTNIFIVDEGDVFGTNTPITSAESRNCHVFKVRK